MILDLRQRVEELICRHHFAVVFDTELVGKFGRIIGLVEVFVIEADRERIVGHKACGDIA